MFNTKIRYIFTFIILLITIFDLFIFGLDMKLFVLPLITLLFFLFGTFKFKINLYFLIIPMYLTFILLYSFLLYFILNTNNLFEILRTFRSLFSFFVYFFLFSFNRKQKYLVFNTFKFLILLHSISILIGIIYPEFENMIYFINNYSKEQLLLRSTGFSSGYDDAGFIINLLIAFNLIDSSIHKVKFITFSNIVLIISVLFTSRFNMIILLLIFSIKFLVDFIYYKKRNFLLSLFPFLLIFLLLFLMSITIDFPKGFRDFTFLTFPILEETFSDFFGSYSDYGIYNYIIGQHIEPLYQLNLIEFLLFLSVL